MKKQPLYKPIVLIILDGWGISTNWTGNCIALAKPRHFDYYWRNFPHLVLQAFSTIAPPNGNLPNSEIGHMILGAGKIIYPMYHQISNQIQNGQFFQNPILNKIANYCFATKTNIHLVGMLSNSGIFSNLEHLYASLIFFKNKNLRNIYIHGILDGLDTEPTSGVSLISQIEQKLQELQIGSINTLVGREWVFDNATTQTNLNAYISSLFSLSAPLMNSTIEALKNSYYKKIFDSKLYPVIISSQNPSLTRIQQNDSIILFNFNNEKLKNFISNLSKYCKNIYSFSDDCNLKTIPLFEKIKIENCLSKILSQNGLRQLKITESYKEKNVNFFFNGLEKNPYPREERIIIESEKQLNIEGYPQLKLAELLEKSINKISDENYDFILINLANVDLTAHTGNINACEQAVSYVDEALASIVQAVFKKQGCAIITADHGAGEDIKRANYHSVNPVPFILINPDNKIEKPHEIL